MDRTTDKQKLKSVSLKNKSDHTTCQKKACVKISSICNEQLLLLCHRVDASVCWQLSFFFRHCSKVFLQHFDGHHQAPHRWKIWLFCLFLLHPNCKFKLVIFNTNTCITDIPVIYMYMYVTGISVIHVFVLKILLS